jgi:hypothetical protein
MFTDQLRSAIKACALGKVALPERIAGLVGKCAGLSANRFREQAAFSSRSECITDIAHLTPEFFVSARP